MGLEHNDRWVESHMWPQQMWVQRSSRGQWPLDQIFEKRVTVSTYFDVFSWDLDTVILEKSHTCDLNRLGVKGHLGVNYLWFKFLKKKVTVSTYFDIFSWDLNKYDPWIESHMESHMWPQQTWGQRSSRGQWPLVQVFWKKKGSLYPHTLTYSHGTWINMILG